MKGVKRELAKGADVNVKKDFQANSWIVHEDIPCLTAAVWSKNEDVVSRLLKEPGINLDATDYLDYTALHHACSGAGAGTSQRDIVRKVDIARMLLMSGANVNSRGLSGKTPLMLAFQTGMKDLIFLLLEHPAIDMNAKDFEGKTALHCALEVVCKYSSVDEAYGDCIQFLAEKAHVDLDAKDNRGRSIEQIAL